MIEENHMFIFILLCPKNKKNKETLVERKFNHQVRNGRGNVNKNMKDGWIC